MILTPFELLQIPKLTRKSKLSVPVYSAGEFLFVGVSSCAINKLSLRPPQVLSAHSVAPGTCITAILPSDSLVLAYASVERGRKHIVLLQQEEGENGHTKPNVVIEVPEEIGALYLSSDKSVIAAVSKTTSHITGYSASDLTELWTDNQGSTGELLYSTSVSDTVSTAGSVSPPNFITVSMSKDSLQLKTYALDKRAAHVLVSTDIEGLQATREVIKNSHFSQNNGLLYQASGSHIYVYRLPDGVALNSFEVAGPEKIDGMLALPNNNIAILRDITIDLIDCSFQSHISTLKLNGKSPIDMLAYSESASAIIIMQNQNILLGLSVVPTQGSLLESVGKGSAHKTKEFAFTDIFAGFSTPSTEFRDTANEQLIKAKAESDAILKDLKSAISTRDGPTFAEIVTYLKTPSLQWKEWHESGEAQGPEEQDLVYEETDRNVSRTTIQKVCEMAFLPRFKPFLPIGVAVYLLTHPLFPIGEPKFKNLLRSLENSDAILYRQALVSLAGLTAKDLVFGLIHQDVATFLDAAVRLQEDFGSQQILQGIRDVFGKMRSISSLGIVIERLSRYPETVGLMGPFIDAMGLLAWDIDHIRRLRSNLTLQVKTIESCFQADAAITELFNAMGIDSSDEATYSSSNRKAEAQYRLTADANENREIPKYSVETLVL